MILYLDDWKQYPTAIADVKTTNESWLRLAGLFKSMGVKNYYFHLALYQPELQNIDPYSDNLTYEQKIAIALECEYNPFYFFREVARLPDGNNSLKFRANRAVISLLWCFLSGIDYALIMVRQTGKSVTCDVLELWLIYFYYRNTELTLFTKDDYLRKINIARIKKTLNLLPKWLNSVSNKDADNMEVITSHARNNIMRCNVGQLQGKLARNVGRGSTSPYIHVDESAVIPNIYLSLPSLMPGSGAARENCEIAGTLYGNIYTTTPGMLDSKEGNYMYNFIYSGMYWSEILYDSKDKHEARAMVTSNSPKGRCLIHGTFNHRQVGKTDEWLRKRILLADATPDEIARDYFLKWTTGAESAAIPTHLLEVIKSSEREPSHLSISSDRYIMKWYIDKEEIDYRLNNGHCIIGLDTSNAVGRDSNGLVITDIRDLAIIAVSNISEANLHKYALWIADFLIKYKNTTLVVENKSSAQGIIDTISVILMANNIDPFKRIYNRIVDGYKTNPEAYSEINKHLSARQEQTYLKYKSSFGFMTTGNSRRFLYDTVLNDAVKSTGHLVKDLTLSDELKGLVIKNGKVDHLVGAHDDLIIGWLLCHWFIKHTKNLSHYGINTLDCLSLVSSDGATLTEEELINKKKIAVLNAEIEDLKKNVASAYTITDSLRAERLLIYKVNEAKGLGDTILNLDTIMKSIEESRTSKRNLRTTVNKINYNRFLANR
jgi:hypothetical protein